MLPENAPHRIPTAIRTARLGVRFGVQMKDGRRFVHDPHIVLADEVREIIVL
jgi:hypothetical protein